MITPTLGRLHSGTGPGLFALVCCDFAVVEGLFEEEAAC